jgi:serine/threonine protein phosphatase PrpC
MSEDDQADTIEFSVPKPSLVGGAPSTSSLIRIDQAALSHRGKVRKNNEDSFLAVKFERRMQTLLSNLPPGNIRDLYSEVGYAMLVADGMGGEVAGEVASRTAISTLVELVAQTPDWIMRIDEESAHEFLQRAERRFRLLKVALVERAKADPHLLGMGTTMTLACSLGTDCLIAHVGDSRAYLFGDGHLIRLTHDQTMAQSLADAGVISSEEIATHPMRHVLTGAISTSSGKAQAELHHIRLKDGDQLLLCSDGLTEMVTDKAIADVLRMDQSAEVACNALVDQALEAGGKDNVTVIVTRYRMPKATG